MDCAPNRYDRRRALVSGAAALLAPAILANAARSQEAPLSVGIVPAYSFGLYWLVQDQNFAPDVAMEFTVFPDGPSAIEAMIGGDVAVVTAGSVPPLSAAVRGASDLRAVSICADASGLFTIIGAPDTATLADLEGRRVAVTAASNFEFFLDQMLTQNGLSDMPLERVNLNPLDGQSSFVAGAVDAVVPLATSRELIFEARPGAQMIIDGADLAEADRPRILDLLLTTQATLDARADAVTDIVRAFHADAVDMVRRDPDAVVERMLAWLTGIGRAGVMADAVAPILAGYSFFDSDAVRAAFATGTFRDALQMQSEFLEAAGRLQSSPNLDALISDEIINRI
ncbi:MAG: ABC transporter substrate-binding protein [Pseudomonadota bacterium]